MVIAVQLELAATEFHIDRPTCDKFVFSTEAFMKLDPFRVASHSHFSVFGLGACWINSASEYLVRQRENENIRTPSLLKLTFHPCQ